MLASPAVFFAKVPILIRPECGELPKKNNKSVVAQLESAVVLLQVALLAWQPVGFLEKGTNGLRTRHRLPAYPHGAYISTSIRS